MVLILMQQTRTMITALMIACENGNIDAINVLLSDGADPSTSDINGDTWIHAAIYGMTSAKRLFR